MFNINKKQVVTFVVVSVISTFFGFVLGERKPNLSARFASGDTVTVEALYHITDGMGKNTDIVFVVRKGFSRGLISMDESHPQVADKLLNALQGKKKVTL